MLDKRLCQKYKVDEVEEFLVNILDNLDDQIEMETDRVKLKALQEQKRIVKKLRQAYEDEQKNSTRN